MVNSINGAAASSEANEIHFDMSVRTSLPCYPVLELYNKQHKCIGTLIGAEIQRSTLFKVTIPVETEEIVAKVGAVVAGHFSAPFDGPRGIEVKNADLAYAHDFLQATFGIKHMPAVEADYIDDEADRYSKYYYYTERTLLLSGGGTETIYSFHRLEEGQGGQDLTFAPASIAARVRRLDVLIEKKAELKAKVVEMEAERVCAAQKLEEAQARVEAARNSSEEKLEEVRAIIDALKLAREGAGNS